MTNPDTLLDEMTALFDASCIIANVCADVQTREGFDLVTRIHRHIRERHQDLTYLNSFEHDIAIVRIKMEYE